MHFNGQAVMYERYSSEITRVMYERYSSEITREIQPRIV
jgi:hypothetical protein